ncbi:MAG: mechanosensitive ion channel [Ardenticatenia bacterium]|nr:mechanosensitive ion channel [Ardenticatenia bacterium]
MPATFGSPQLLAALAAALLVALLMGRAGARALTRRGMGTVLLFAAASLGFWLVDGPLGRPGTWHGLAAAFWWLALIQMLLRLLDAVVWERHLARRSGRAFPRLLVDVFNVAVLVVVALLALDHYFPGQLKTVLVTSTIASAAIGLALQDVLRGVVAGLVLQAESPFSLGDWVQISGHEGRVEQLNWRTATLRTRENNLVVIGNDKITGEDIVNFSRPDPRHAQDVFVGLGYECPPEQVKAVLLTAAGEVVEVVADPAPRAFTMSYDDFSIGYRLRYWITDPEAAPRIRDRIMSRFWYGLRRAGMAIPFPIRDVNLRAVPPDADERRRDAEREDIAAVLRPLALLAPLSDDQIDVLAAGARRQVHAPGEILLREGAPGDSLLVISRGRLGVAVGGPDGRVVPVTERGPGEIVGEMSLLTGEPRTATVSALAETETIDVGKHLFAQVLLADPAIAEGLSVILVRRVLEQKARVSEAGSNPEAPVSEHGLRRELQGRIRRFFGMAEG